MFSRIVSNGHQTIVFPPETKEFPKEIVGELEVIPHDKESKEIIEKWLDPTSTPMKAMKEDPSFTVADWYGLFLDQAVASLSPCGGSRLQSYMRATTSLRIGRKAQDG